MKTYELCPAILARQLCFHGFANSYLIGSVQRIRIRVTGKVRAKPASFMSECHGPCKIWWKYIVVVQRSRVRQLVGEECYLAIVRQNDELSSELCTVLLERLVSLSTWVVVVTENVPEELLILQSLVIFAKRRYPKIYQLCRFFFGEQPNHISWSNSEYFFASHNLPPNVIKNFHATQERC